MKPIKLIIYCVAVLFSCPKMVAQNGSLLPDNNTQWEYRISDPGGQMHQHQYVIGDTIIDTIIYTKFRIDNYEYTHDPAGGKAYGSSEFLIFTVEGMIFRRDKLVHDLLIFDSNWAVGDTIVDDLNMHDTIIVESIDTVEIGGVQRRKWNFKSIFPECSHCSAGFIEGIGTTNYNLMYPAYHMYWEGGSDLICCHLNNEYVIQDFCRFSTYIDFVDHPNPFRIYPNPSSSQFFIESNSPYSLDATLFIYNAFGQLKRMQKISSNVEGVEISDLPPGIYMVKVMDGKRRWHETVIIH